MAKFIEYRIDSQAGGILARSSNMQKCKAWKTGLHSLLVQLAARWLEEHEAHIKEGDQLSFSFRFRGPADEPDGDDEPTPMGLFDIADNITSAINQEKANKKGGAK